MAVSGLLVSVGASAGQLAAFSLGDTSAHVSVHSRERRFPVAKDIEKRLERLATELGTPDVPHVDYYHYESASDIAAITGYFVDGVTFANVHQVHSTNDATDHELVHILTEQLGHPGTFFQEGLAVALGNRGRLHGHNVDDVARRAASGIPVSALIARFDTIDPEKGYSIAGSFVKFLIKRHGVDTVARFFHACSGQPTATAFTAVFGSSLDAEGAAWARQL